MSAAAADPAAAYVASAGPLQIDDLLHIEDFRGAAFSPDGSRLAYEIVRSPAQLRGRFYDASGYDDLVVCVVDVASGRQVQVSGETSRDRFGLAPWGNAFSPDGRYVAMRATRPDRSGMAIYDVRKRRAQWLPGGLSSYFVANAWTSDNRLLYAAAPQGGGDMSGVRVAQALTQRWTATAEGHSPQVTVISSHPSVPSNEVAVGALMIASSDGAALALADGDYTMIAVAPGGERFAAIRRAERSAGKTFDGEGRRGELQVFRLAAKGAALEASFVEHDISALSLSWSANGDALLAAGVEKHDSQGRVRLFRYDTVRRALDRMETGDLLLENPSGAAMLEILPRGWLGSTPVVIGARPSADAQSTNEAPPSRDLGGLRLDYGEYANLRFDLWALEPSGPRKLTEFARADVRVFADPAGYDGVFVVADGALWSITRDAPADRLTPESGLPVVAFAGAPGAAARRAFSSSEGARRSVHLMIVHQGEPVEARFDLSSRTLEPLAPGSRVVATTPDFSHSLVREKRGYRSTLTSHHEDGEREIASINGFLDEKVAGELVRLTYEVEGRELIAWAIKPPGMPAGQRAPAVVSVYGGLVWGATPPPFAQIDQPSHVFNGQLLAAQGYVVLYPSLPLGPGHASDVPALLAESTLAALDAAVEQGFIDSARVAVMGQSFGGFSTAAILAKSARRFKAGIALAGIYSWPTVYGSRELGATLSASSVFWPGSMLFAEQGQIGLQQPPWKDPQAYVRNSPLFLADSIDAPLMIMQGDRDSAITSLYGAQQMYAALVRAGKQPVLVRYWGESHVVASQANIRDQWQRIVAWLDLNLRGGAGE